MVVDGRLGYSPVKRAPAAKETIELSYRQPVFQDRRSGLLDVGAVPLSRETPRLSGVFDSPTCGNAPVPSAT